jgi:hypothetical protein
MRATAWLVVAIMLAACGGGAVKEAPPPIRPKAKPRPPKDKNPGRVDCDPITLAQELPALKYDERSVEESQNLAEQGFELLKGAEARSVSVPEQERLIEQSVLRFMTALAADPYNVHATYNLAAAYARIGRPQCSVNLLARLVALRKLPSQTAAVEEKLDRLFGRKQYDGRLDPDFLKLRDDGRFREVAKKLQ